MQHKARNKSSIYKSWEALQPAVRFGSAGENIDKKTILTIAGAHLELYRKPRTSIAYFETEARAIGFLE